jgi:3',5'-cyclic AMP phosphodiesterase CpdA
MLIAQITDSHITAPGEVVADRVDPTDGLARAVEVINGFGDDVALVLGTGDLVNDGRSDEYDRLMPLLAGLRAPFVPLPGNHDDRSELRTRFPGLPAGSATDPIDHVVELDGVRVVCLDTTIPGRHDGALSAGQIAWLDGVLAAAPAVPTLVAQHHPPFPSGLRSMDQAFGFATADDEAAVVRRHGHVLAVVAGHYHRAITTPYAGTVAMSAPSCAVQLAADFATDDALYSSETPGLVLHRIVGATAASYVLSTAAATTWVPEWARRRS